MNDLDVTKMERLQTILITGGLILLLLDLLMATSCGVSATFQWFRG